MITDPNSPLPENLSKEGEKAHQPEPPIFVNPDRKLRRSWRTLLAGSPVFILSLLIHGLFIAIALFFVVQRIHEKRKQTFSEVSVTVTPKQIEHKVQLAQMQKAQSAPDVSERIVTNTLSAVVLPEITMPSETPTEGKMGVGSTGALGTGEGAGGGGQVSVDVSTIAASAFGQLNGNGLGLAGEFYDLKQMRSRGPTGMTIAKFPKVVAEFLNGGWKADYFNTYFKAPKPLYLPQLFTPYMIATDGPKAYGVEALVKPMLWVVLYKGKVSVKRSGTYRFVGAGDDLCEVQLDNKFVFDGSWRGELSKAINLPSPELYTYSFPVDLKNKKSTTLKFSCGEWISLTADQPYDMQILVGEHPGGFCGFWLMVQEKGHTYAETPQKSPILPLFRLSEVKMPPVDIGCPPYDKNAQLNWTVLDDGTNAGMDPGSTN